MKVYLASSWRNQYYEQVLKELTEFGLEVHDFRDERGHFLWSDIDTDWKNWTTEKYIANLQNHLAGIGYNRDKEGIDTSDICVLLLPCNRSAHTEAGYMKGTGKPVFALIPERQEPELMYRLFDGIFTNTTDLLNSIKLLIK